MFLGWWGFPWELILTPVQVARNLMGMLRKENLHSPSPQLENIARLNIAQQALTARRPSPEG